MATHRDAIFVNRVYVEKAPLPDDVPHVSEVGATSAALETAAFFIGAHCKELNEDFMLCKRESPDPRHCLKEGRRVTRCAQDVIRKIKASCDEEWKAYYEAFDWQNHMYQSVRKEERAFNDCVLKKLGLEKQIPGTPENVVPIHLREKHMLH
ncbi:hypothetical protein DFJ74DRAFT_683561 [Hyaloraphidium curvatum]|nr:hypothetical protein DFJ74DRAFT_683561 [Hyaloraphidium curvatum]